MRAIKRFVLQCVIISAVAVFAGGCRSSSSNDAPPPAPTGQTVFTRDVFLNNKQLTTPSVSVMTGTARFVLDTAVSSMSGTLALSAVTTTVTAVHIHDGDVGVDGPVIVPLTETSPGSHVWTTPSSLPAGFDAQKFKGGGYYLNVHTPANPAGEIRGQLLSYAENIQPIFDANCTVCHSFVGAARTTFLFLTSEQSYSTLVNANATITPGDIRVIPFDYETSVLFERILGTGRFTGIDQMPRFGVSLSARDRDLIKSWIMMGAMKDGSAPSTLNATFTRNTFLTSGQTASSPPVTSATGTARVVLDTVSTKVSGTMIVSGISTTNAITAVELRDGLIGTSGALFAALEEISPGSGVWTVPASAPALLPAQRLAFRKAGFHILVSTTANTTGELRGQLMSYAGNIQPLFDKNCAMCHQVGGSAGFTNLWLNQGISWGRLVDQLATQPTTSTFPTGTRVIPFNASSSELYKRASGIGLPLVYRMPPNGPFLSNPDTDMIKVWIDMGAAND